MLKCRNMLSVCGKALDFPRPRLDTLSSGVGGVGFGGGGGGGGGVLVG